MNHVFVRGLGKYLPEKVLTNQELEKIVDTTDEWITTRTGIKERHIADDAQATSDLAVQAALEAIRDAGLTPQKIDLIINATITGDLHFPASACIIQEKLKAYQAVAFDVSAACAGFPYALSVASQFIRTGTYQNVLVIGAEILSRFIDWSDRATCVLFGDGAGAAVISSEGITGERQVIDDYLGTDGRYVEFLQTPGGGSRYPVNSESLDKGLHHLKMEGKTVFKVAVEKMVEATKLLLNKNGLSVADISCLIPHQANLRIIKAVGKGLSIPDEKVFVNVDHYGNMSSATTIVALYDANKKNVIAKGDNIVMVAFGGGFVWSSTLIKW